MWAMFYQWPKIPKSLIFKKIQHFNKAFGSYHIPNFIYISTQGVCGKILGPKKCLNIFYESLNFFFQKTKSWIFFKDLVGIFKLVQI